MMPSLKSRCVDGFHQFKGIIEALNRRFQWQLEEDQSIASSISADDLDWTEPTLRRIYFEATCGVR